MLEESKCQANEVILYTDFSFENLKILQNFLIRGILPCSKERIISSEISHLFHTFGIEWNLNAVFKTPTIFVKKEPASSNNAIKTDIPMNSDDEDDDEEEQKLVLDEKKVEIKREPEEIILKIPKNEIIANDTNDDSDISDEDICLPELMIDTR